MDQDDAVTVQEDLRGEQASALVPVDERVVRHDVKQIGRRHREEPLVHVRAAEGRLRLRYRRLEQASIAQPGRAAIALD